MMKNRIKSFLINKETEQFEYKEVEYIPAPFVALFCVKFELYPYKFTLKFSKLLDRFTI